MRVLLVEDDDDSRAFLEAALTAHGHQAISANDGLQALEMARQQAPDLIVSDILMPQMDGFDLCRVVRGDSVLRGIPLVFYTATYTDDRDKQLGLALGASRFLVKPMEVDLLLRELDDVIHATYTDDTAPSATPQDVPAPAPDINAEHLAVVSKKLRKKVAELEAANAALAASEGRFQQLAANIQECFWMVDIASGELIYGSPAMSGMWGFSAEQRQQRPEIWRERIHPDDRQIVEEELLRAARQRPAEATFRILRAGEVRWLRERAFPVRDEAGLVYRIAGLTEDVSETRRLTERLQYHANHDLLTGLFNRNAFEHELRALLESTTAVDSHALCYFDLDQFKIVNESCGHSAGDQLLRQLADAIAARVRKSDLFARLGGDEFAILMRHCTLEQADRLAHAILDLVQAFRFHWGDSTFSVGASVGVVPLNVQASTGSVLAAADAACYVAKAQGGNRRHIYRDDDEALVTHHDEMRWVSRITEALDARRFELHYQGIHPVSASHDSLQRVELLLRLRDADGGLVMPGAFMPAVHRYGLARRVDAAVLKLACHWLADRGRWVDSCSVNLSAPSLSDPDLVSTVRDLIAHAGIDGGRLCFEITETAALGNLTEVRSLMESLRCLGCRFSVDDFGSGFSSFAYLKALPIDYLKIDGQFVVEVEHDPLQKAMVRSINEIGQTMGAQTIAEWVESARILNVIDDIGVDFAQGFHLSRPTPCEP